MKTATYTPITAKNVTTFGIGTRVRFNYGVGCGHDDGLIVDYKIDRWGAHLIAETSDGQIKDINGFSTVGIGCHLIERV